MRKSHEYKYKHGENNAESCRLEFPPNELDEKATFSLRLNKIGKNPHLVSDRETLDSDWRQMNALLKALSVNADPQSPNANAIEDNLRELVRLHLIRLS